MNKFKKKTRSKMIAASIAILSSAAVVSTGFAAWVISGGDTKNTTGTITADTVEESYHTITFGENTETTINFAAPANDDSVKDPWLTNGAMGQEKLLAKFEFTVANVKKGETDAPNKLFSSIELSAGADTTYSKAAGEKLVSALPTWEKTTYDPKAPVYSSKDGNGDSAGIYLVKSPSTEPTEGKPVTLSFTLYIQFTWGENFGYKNPFYFYNVTGKTASKDGVEANTRLTTVAAIQNVNFSLTITTK